VPIADVELSNETHPNELEFDQKKSRWSEKDQRLTQLTTVSGGTDMPGGMGTPRGKSERSKVRLRIRRLDDLRGTLDHPKAQLLQCPFWPEKRTFSEAVPMSAKCQ